MDVSAGGHPSTGHISRQLATPRDAKTLDWDMPVERFA
jgi:hypothetical protein